MPKPEITNTATLTFDDTSGETHSGAVSVTVVVEDKAPVRESHLEIIASSQR